MLTSHCLMEVVEEIPSAQLDPVNWFELCEMEYQCTDFRFLQEEGEEVPLLEVPRLVHDSYQPQLAIYLHINESTCMLSSTYASKSACTRDTCVVDDLYLGCGRSD